MLGLIGPAVSRVEKRQRSEAGGARVKRIDSSEERREVTAGQQRVDSQEGTSAPRFATMELSSGLEAAMARRSAMRESQKYFVAQLGKAAGW